MAYPEYILKYLRLRSGMDENDHSFDKRFNAMNPDAVFEEVLRWQGIIGWGTQIRGWIEGIYGVDLDKPQLRNELMMCTGCMYLDNEPAPCAYCIRSKPEGDYYRCFTEMEEH